MNEDPIFDENQINQQQAQFVHWYTDEKKLESNWSLNPNKLQRLLKAKTEIQRRNMNHKPPQKHYGGTAN